MEFDWITKDCGSFVSVYRWACSDHSWSADIVLLDIFRVLIHKRYKWYSSNSLDKYIHIQAGICQLCTYHYLCAYLHTLRLTCRCRLAPVKTTCFSSAFFPFTLLFLTITFAIVVTNVQCIQYFLKYNITRSHYSIVFHCLIYKAKLPHEIQE